MVTNLTGLSLGSADTGALLAGKSLTIGAGVGMGFWNAELLCSDESPEYMETGRLKRNVTFDPVLVKPLLRFTEKSK